MNRTLARAPFVVSVVAALLLLLSGLGSRAGLWHFRVGFRLLRDAAFLGAAGALFGLVLVFVPRVRVGHVGTLLAAIVIGAFAFGLPYQQNRVVKQLPMIHDITTDTDNPPQFVEILKLRTEVPNTVIYGGPAVANEQKRAYPDIQPLVLSEAPAAAFPKALDAAKAMGWQIVATDPATGRIEATATTRWFGFKDDVIVRIRPEGTGSRMDVRSVSRVGKSDVGTNAARIREYVGKVKGGGAAPVSGY
jgi:uncharacterized protein (DUF1499 family)